jgi:hypothetical protein
MKHLFACFPFVVIAVLLETMHWQWPENMTWLWFGLSDSNAITARNRKYLSFHAAPPSSKWYEIAVAVGLARLFGECGRLSYLVIPCFCESAAFCCRCWIWTVVTVAGMLRLLILIELLRMLSEAVCAVSAWTWCTQCVKWGRGVLCLPDPNWITLKTEAAHSP